eukprot:gene3497-biopygen3515
MVYMAPECMAGRASYPSDLWSLGLTALHLATGQVPWRHLRDGNGNPLNDTQLMFHIAQESNAHLLPPDLHPWLAKLVQECLRYKPVDRPTSQTSLEYLCSLPNF